MMQPGSRTFAAQIALAAAFGGALAWKSFRLRRPAAQPSRIANAHRVEAPAPFAPNGAPRQAPREATQMLSRFDVVPWPALGMLLLGTLAVVVVIAAFVMALSRSHDHRGARAAAAPTASAAPSATTLPARTPTLPETFEDARRALDLADVRDALAGYVAFFGKYPSTGGGFQTLCAQPSDAGCTLNKYARNLPLSDGTHAYWYASDGRSFTVLARVAVPPREDNCPDDLPATLRDTPVYCISDSIPAR
jgi:hypothetical protein